MNKRELTLLAHDYEPLKHSINGWFASEKLDGQRAIWLPSTRGSHVADIAFANRERDSRDHIATGLWSRYGKVIHAPAWFLDSLPEFNLDGELWIERGSFQLLSSCVRKLVPLDSEWRRVKFLAFDMPPCTEFWKAGRIYTPNYKYVFNGEIGWKPHTQPQRDFPAVLAYLQKHLRCNDVVKLHDQVQLDFGTARGLEQLALQLTEVVGSGGEGLILRHYNLTWEPNRSHSLLKVKPELTGICVVKDWTLGKGKLSGMFGALVVEWEGKTFELSGFTNEERTVYAGWPKHFPAGMEIAFKYRELTDAGIPKEARFNRP